MGMLEELYEPDKKRLNVIIAGQPGSGKSFFIERTLAGYLTKTKDEYLRVVYISPKHETILNLDPIPSDKLEKHLQKNRVAVIMPGMDYIDDEVDYVIDTMFALRASNPKLKTVIVIDDSQVFLSSRRDASPSLKRLTLTGRSMNIRAVFVSHAIILNKALEGAVQYILNFTLPQPMFFKDAQRRYGFDPEPYQEQLRDKPYGYVFHDVTKGVTRLMDPIDP